MRNHMKLHTLALISTLALSAAALRPAHADTLYSQAPTTAHADLSGSGVDYVSYDNFTLGANGTVTSVTWYGYYSSSQSQDPAGAYFTIDIFSNSSGAPGTLLSSTTVGGGSPTDTGVSLHPGQDSYSYSATIDPFSATGGTEYWLSIISTPGDLFLWAWQSGSGGDGINFADGTGIGSTTFFVPYDLAFTLSGSTTAIVATPEPSPLLLLVTGILVIAAFSRLSVHKELEVMGSGK
jgi:hypothetical protein